MPSFQTCHSHPHPLFLLWSTRYIYYPYLPSNNMGCLPLPDAYATSFWYTFSSVFSSCSLQVLSCSLPYHLSVFLVIHSITPQFTSNAFSFIPKHYILAHTAHILDCFTSFHFHVSLPWEKTGIIVLFLSLCHFYTRYSPIYGTPPLQLLFPPAPLRYSFRFTTHSAYSSTLLPGI